MKYDLVDVLILVGVCVVGGLCFPTIHGATPTPTPAIDYSTFTDEEIAATEAHRNALKQQLSDSLSKVGSTAVEQGASISDIKKAGDDTQKAFTAYQLAAEAQITAGNKAIAALAHVLTQLHRAKWVMCGLWLALCAFIALKLQKVPVIGQYALYGVAALAIAGITFIWIWM